MRRIFVPTLLLTLLFLPMAAATAQSVIFEEDFDDGVADGFQPDNNLWTVSPDGLYEIENWGFEVYSKAYFGESWWGDFLLSLEMRTFDSVHNTLAFRIQDQNNHYEVALRGEPYKDVFLFKIVDGVQHLLFTDLFSNTLTAWHHLELAAAGNRFLFFVDGELAIDFEDHNSPFMWGSMALVSYTGGVAQHQLLQVDNVMVINPVVGTDMSYLDRLKALYR